MSHEEDRLFEWRSADGRRIKICDMELHHLINVINWIGDNAEKYPDYILPIMTTEAKYRQTLLFAQGKEYPQLVGTRWKLVDPVTGEGKIVPPPKEYIEAVRENEAYQVMYRNTQSKRRKEGLI